MRVGILGCGYVGLELARQLGREHDVIGVRRSGDGLAAVEEAGADAIEADVTDPGSLSAIPDVDALVFSASSGGRGAAAAERVYVDGLRTVIELFGERDAVPDRLVYTSSTGVYGDHGGDWVDEETPLSPTTDKTRVLAEAERIARELAPEYGIDGAVARFAGLYGPGRYRLDRYLNGPVTEGYLNMIHRDDAAGECGVERPPKRTKADRLEDEGLTDAARRRILTSKRCSNERVRGLGYQFAYPTYREGYRAAIDAYRSDR
jgi:nucleoside-diphosphate-sugar epimerase